ncbi:MAG: OmpA family protein [Aureispira sp.]|nr:OmpA family protein [Aureispira sp.]
MTTRTLIYIISLGLLQNALIAQNLVKNGSFEEGFTCDGTTEIIKEVDTWIAVAGSPRFFNLKCPLSKESKTYVQGKQMPSANTGDVYAAMGIDVEGEYLQSELTKPLEKDKIYVVKARVRVPTRFCNTAIDELGVVLAAQPFEVTKDYRKIDTTSLKLKNNTKTTIGQTHVWEEISVKYIGQGGEEYITIGNFSDNNRENFAIRKKGECTYLYIDDISVEEFKEITLKGYSKGQQLKEGDRLVLKNIEFVPGLAALNDTTNATLNALAKTLTEKTEVAVEVSGHTDNTSDAAISQKFSQDRAKAVVDYLLSKGVAAAQLKAVGKGSSMNIADNDSENNRKKNNRIEIRVSLKE